MFRLNNKEELTQEVLKKIVTQYQMNELPRLKRLKDYYLNKTDILKRVEDDPSRPNNRVVHPYAQYITDTLTGYFMGEPVAYSSKENIDSLKLCFEYNDEQDENMELAKNCSIYGVGWEYLYIDEDAALRFMSIDPQEIIPIYGSTVEDNLVAVIRFYMEYDIVKGQNIAILEVYDDQMIHTFKGTENLSSIQLVSEAEHAFGTVPFVKYTNNKDEVGDFEGVMSLIDAYDILVSDDLNDYEYFCDAYLALYGYNADADDVREMKENRVLLMDVDTKAEWLIKQGDSQGVEQEKARIESDIHKFSKTPNINDEKFGGNSSGVAMKYKLLGTENLGSIKERKFKKGLQRRLEVISNMFNLLGRPSFNWMAVTMAFTRNLPINEQDVAAMISSLDGIVSKKTLVSQLPFVEDIDEEMIQLKQETGDLMAYTSGLVDKGE